MCLKLQKRELLQQKLQVYRHMIELEIRFILRKQKSPMSNTRRTLYYHVNVSFSKLPQN